ncbi:MAG: hypothetical protein A3F84_00535 [Candidatus Handelsmanbacteria bacterium RIFCSPLOWO2_12_FULL_64_10]|uniref:Uncharacterized protein n=1 Tax=Handelsmanbacteria sp. (strain RIFCSPLOWO2_12_FULL_64_10) TaxID=1817868 RepID=A0A1F6C6T2_HANXR|nr:MAG: hypothetical protein A3F84_00535 [Candidatus Handelsmanbacteria bacterium RIFCSPLOWO2_12_FULL_64_10]
MDTPSQNASRALTVRALCIGAVATVAINAVAPYSEWVVRSTYMTTSYFPLGLVFAFILVVVVLNPLLKLFRRRSGLREDELGVIYIMLLAAVSVPTYGITGYVISIAASPFYFASTENRWADFILPHIPRGVTLREGDALTHFFEGLPPGRAIPWGAWTGPLCWWTPLIVATLAFSACLVALFRRQWVERERLNFPLAEVPLEMMRASDDDHILPRFMRSKLFWGGFALSIFRVVWNIPGYFLPHWTSIPLIALNLPRGPIFPGIWTYVSFWLIGLCYFVNVDVILSVWFFYLFNTAETILFNRTGFSIGGSETYSIDPSTLAWQGFGAFAAMVAGGVWVARSHLRDAFRKAFRGDPSVDDSGEILSYRAAVFGLLLSALFILLWLCAVGVSLPAALLLLLSATVIYLGLTRIAVEGGLVFVRSPLVPQALPLYALGPANLGGATMTGLALSYGWTCDPIAIFMPSGANAARIHSDRRFPRGTYVTAVALALAISLVVSFYVSLKLAYAFGGFNFGEWVFTGGGRVPYDTMVQKIRAAEGVGVKRLLFMGGGALVTACLTALRHRFLWWRFHPIGFSVASVGQVRLSVLTLFLAWLVKMTIIRVGGLILYNRAKPFFVGLVLGHFTGAGLSFLIDVIWFQGRGHSLYW